MLPLEGLRVLDFSQNGDGPTCGLMLAEAGAAVIKIEPLHGDAFRGNAPSAFFNNVNRNKRGLALNLHPREGKEIAHRLASTADIVLESFTPGVADMLGIGYNELSKINPRIIYCSVSGFGQTGPYRHKPAYDPVIQAISGSMSVTGEPGRPPIRIAPAMIGNSTAFLAGYNILLAVIQREKTGRGQLIDAAFFDTALFFMSPFIANYLQSGFVMPKMGSANAMSTPYQCFQSADRYIFIGVSTDKFWQAFCKALALEDLASNPDFSRNASRLKHRTALISELSAILRKLPSAEILEKLEAASVPCAPVMEIPELPDNPQAQARSLFFNFEYPGAGRIKLTHIPGRPSAIEHVECTKAPMLGEHTRDILIEAGYSGAEIDALAARGVILRD